MYYLFLLIAIVLLVGCNKQEISVDLSDYTVHDIQVENKLYLGNDQAENEILLVFDYSCIWCKKWINEVLPELNETLISSGIAKYYSQPLSLLSEKSLFMANADYVIKKKLSHDYYDIQARFATDSELDDWGTELYVDTVLSEYDASLYELKTGVNIPDNLSISRMFTKNFDVTSVPSLFVNNMKVADPFDVSEIKALLHNVN